MKSDFNNRDFIRQLQQTARGLRAQQSFAGIEIPLISIQKKMLVDFETASQIKHNGDRGTAREGILREFLTKHDYLPSRFAVSPGSTHVASASGQASGQMDLVIYDALSTPKLFAMSGVQYLPVESVYGAISVKSDLNSIDRVHEGLDNLASFKVLRAPPTAKGNSAGFGILFAYDASLKWSTLFEAVLEWQRARPSQLWPNIVVVLNQGILLQNDSRRTAIHTQEIDMLPAASLHAVVGDDSTLIDFYVLLSDMLNAIELPPLSLREYVRLPDRMDDYSVRFLRGPFDEVRSCDKHGKYLRRLKPGSARMIVQQCAKSQPIDRNHALAEAYGNLANDELRNAKASYSVRILNPEAHSLSDILLVDSIFPGTLSRVRSLSFEELQINDEIYWLPSYYALKHDLIEECTQCDSNPAAARLTIQDWQRVFRERSDETLAKIASRTKDQEKDAKTNK